MESSLLDDVILASSEIVTNSIVHSGRPTGDPITLTATVHNDVLQVQHPPCLPVGMVGEGAAGTGTVMRPKTVEAYARDAGFTQVEVAPIENDFWRFYLMRP